MGEAGHEIDWLVAAVEAVGEFGEVAPRLTCLAAALALAATGDAWLVCAANVPDIDKTCALGVRHRRVTANPRCWGHSRRSGGFLAGLF